MTDNALDEATLLRIDRLLPAPIELVFAAWTDPLQMAGWMSPTGAAEVEADVRLGGTFTVVMLGADWRIEHTGEYLEVDPPRRLTFTWNSPYTGPEPSVVTVDLVPEGEATRLTLTHRQLPEDAVARHRDGWGQIVANLATFLGRS